MVRALSTPRGFLIVNEYNAVKTSLKLIGIKQYVRRVFAVMCLYILVMVGAISAKAAEETFPLLQIGTRTYTNVTITTKTKSQIFIMHSAGMHTVKVADLEPELRSKLGYGTEPEQKSTKGLAALGTIGKKSGLKLKLPDFKGIQKQWQSRAPSQFATITWSPSALLILASSLLLLYVMFSYCGMLICTKAGHEPGALIWIPVLQLIPLLRAAGMSGAWFLAYFVPGLNLIGHILWSFKIAQARGKSPFVGVLLLFPVTNILGYLYLALSNGAVKKEGSAVEIMTLEAA
jgi:hypothetical protein